MEWHTTCETNVEQHKKQGLRHQILDPVAVDNRCVCQDDRRSVSTTVPDPIPPVEHLKQSSCQSSVLLLYSQIKEKQLCHGPRSFCLPSENMQHACARSKKSRRNRKLIGAKNDIICWRGNTVFENKLLQKIPYSSIVVYAVLVLTVRLVSPNPGNT